MHVVSNCKSSEGRFTAIVYSVVEGDKQVYRSTWGRATDFSETEDSGVKHVAHAASDRGYAMPFATPKQALDAAKGECGRKYATTRHADWRDYGVDDSEAS